MMKIEDLMVIMKKSRQEIEEMFKSQDVIEINLREPSRRESLHEEGRIELLN